MACAAAMISPRALVYLNTIIRPTREQQQEGEEESRLKMHLPRLASTAALSASPLSSSEAQAGSPATTLLRPGREDCAVTITAAICDGGGEIRRKRQSTDPRLAASSALDSTAAPAKFAHARPPRQGRRPHDVRPTEAALPPAVAALLAVTDIPPRRPRSSSSLRRRCSSSSPASAGRDGGGPRRRRAPGQRATTTSSVAAAAVAAAAVVVSLTNEAETEKAVAARDLGGPLGPLELLLSPPLGLDGDDAAGSCSDSGGRDSWRGLSPAVSTESMSSLCDSFFSISVDSVDGVSADAASFVTASTGTAAPVSPARGKKKFRPVRQEREVVSPPAERASDDHPLAPDLDMDELDLGVFDSSPASRSPGRSSSASSAASSASKTEDYYLGRTIGPLRSAFKLNLTASLRALRTAARSFSSLNFSSIPADDFLTRSILAIDPSVPFTDERRPPVLEETPPAALRRYLNPTSRARIEPRGSSPPSRGPLPASIRMQTYKTGRLRGGAGTGSSGSPPSPASIRMRDHLPPPSPSPHRAAAPAPAPPPRTRRAPLPPPPPVSLPPAMRPREMRENSDFIRIAVMEMAMRRRGKLDDKRPGRARWALPPRKCSTKPYVILENGVPRRWTPLTPDDL